MESLKQKIAQVTGAGRGIGKAIAPHKPMPIMEQNINENVKLIIKSVSS